MSATYPDLHRQAMAARKQRQLEVALPLFRRIWYEFPVERSAWDGWGYAWCLYQQRHYSRAMAVISEALSLESLEVLTTLKAWCLYQTTFHEDPLPRHAGQTLDCILALCQQAELKYSPVLRALFKAIDSLDKHKPEHMQQALDWLLHLDPEQLSRQPQQFTDSQGKTRSLPSDWLRYQSRLSEALLATQQAQACIAACEAVLAAPAAEVQSGQRLWFQRRLARAFLQGGQQQAALQLYTQLLKRKQDWFLYKEYAEALLVDQQFEAALQAACQGALAAGEPAKKVRLYAWLAEQLADKQPAVAQQHLVWLACLRQQQGWPLSAQQAELLAGLPQGFEPRKLYHQLRQFWREQLPAQPASAALAERPSGERLKGKIFRLMPHGRAGFIRDQQGQSWYFQCHELPKDKPQEKLEGQAVSFGLKAGYDHKKQCETQQATAIAWLDKT